MYNTCIPALIGDDIGAVCREAQRRWGTPFVPVDGAGFYGTQNLGNRIAGDALVSYVCGTREPAPVLAGIEKDGFRVHDVTLIGEYNIAGELWHLLPLLDELGLRVLCTLSGDARFREVQTMHRSEVNMMVCSKAMINVARKLEDAFGTPWFEGSFYGVQDVSQALRDFDRLIADPELTHRTEELISAMGQISSVMGANENLVEGLATICEKNNPDLVGVPTTGLSEAQGADIRMAVHLFCDRYPQYASVAVVPVSTPDFRGCMESGFAMAVEAVIENLVPSAFEARTCPGRRSWQVNILASSHLTPGDLEHLKDLIELFGLRPILLPDLSQSLDGHLADPTRG